MACERYRDALTDVAAGAPASAGVLAHLSTCEACRLELATLRGALAVVDDEMTRLLAAAPSPELAARVRAALAESELRAPPFRLGWRFALTAAAAALFVAVVFVASRDSRPRHEAVVTDVRPEPTRETPAAAPRPVPVETPLSVRPRPRARHSERARPEPEVLVPAGEAEALLRFAASLQRRAVTPDSLLVADLSGPLPEPRGVLIRPLQIVPLDPEETPGAE